MVDADGTSVKLAGVRVMLFPEETIRAHVAEREQAYEAALARAHDENAALARMLAEGAAVEDSLEAVRVSRMRAEWKQATADLAEARARARQARIDAQGSAKQYADAHQRRMTAATPEQIARGAIEPVEERRRMDALSAAADREEAREGDLERKVASLKAQLVVAPPRPAFRSLPEPRRTTQMYFVGLPAPTAVVETDPDGRFTLRVPNSGTWVIAARAERRAGGTVEHLDWMVRIPPGGEGDALLLNDDCTMNSGSPSTVVRVEGGN